MLGRLHAIKKTIFIYDRAVKKLSSHFHFNIACILRGKQKVNNDSDDAYALHVCIIRARCLFCHPAASYDLELNTYVAGWMAAVKAQNDAEEEEDKN
jgi:hypothetical protein